MNEHLRTRLGAVILALVTLAAVIFAALNFQQRSRFVLPDDGVTWMDSAQGVTAWHIVPGSPADRAGIREGDDVQTVAGVPIRRATDVTRVLYRSGPWTEVKYGIRRNGESLDVPLITVPQDTSSSIENYLRLTALLYLFIGLFIFVRRWNAPRAIHFYVFCLASFILYSFHYTGKLNSFDWIIYWSNAAALLVQPALLLHFALVFPERRGTFWGRIAPLGVYVVPTLLLALQIFVATGTLDFMPSISSRQFLDQIDLLYLGSYFLLAAGVFLASYFRAPSGVLRQQLKWVTGGTIAGIVPVFLLYILPFLFSTVLPSWTKLSVFSLALIPLCFGYAVIRYRLMDVDIIFKRGLAYTFATAGVVTIYFAAIAVIGELFHTAWPTGPGGAIIAIVVAAFLFQPLRDWVQARLDHFFYRDRLDYRRTLIEFGRALTNEVRIEPLLASVLDRVSQTLLVDRLAVFLEDSARPGQFALSRSIGIRSEGPLDLSFLNPARPALVNGCLFFESARSATEETESARGTIEELGLNYFIPCRFHDHAPAVLGLGKSVDGDYLSSEDLELLSTIAGYVAIAVENARLYQSLEQKALQIERLKDFNENIVESLRIGVLTADLEDRIESWNPQLEDLLEIPRGEALGRKIDDVLPRDLSGEIFSRATAEHVSGIYKFHLTMRSGKHVVVNASVAPLLGKDGARLGRLVLLDDITQRVRLEDQMVQTEKLTSLGLLAAGVAHEVNTPLAVISNYIQMLAKQIPADDPRQKTIERIVKQTFRASEIVNNLLNFSRTGGTQPVDVDLNAVLEETLTLVQHPFKAASISVVRNYAQPLPVVLGSTTRLQQVFLNLFMNARDAMPSGGMLEVRTGAHNGSVEVEVVDTGAGIPAEHLHRIFDPFFTTKATGRGTGLGLSVSYGIIKEHAGKVDVRSTPGKGTSFRLEFPVARKAVHA
ncbi:MAG TPA: ATP-binding protein [Candidatus Acidoferrales bacterium]|jgi:PAS domain S-box-containing protein|nr:ATP-binding protein [Candidatus Acidoferrales bacterium]